MKPLTPDERVLLASLLSRKACQDAAENEAQEQARRRNEAYLASSKFEEETQLRSQAERDQVYSPGIRGGRKQIQLSAEDAVPKVDPITERLNAINARLAEIELVSKPAPQSVAAVNPTWSDIFLAFRKMFWGWVTR